jgi:hypothetical protein
MSTIELKPGDPCPGCGGTLRKAQQPTAAERKRAEATTEVSEWVPLPPHYDTAPQHVVDALGELWKCPDCGFPHRFPAEPAAPAKKGARAAAAE